jgi:hypothetical protein
MVALSDSSETSNSVYMALATDAPVISPHHTHLAAEPYRASGLVRWHETDLPTGADDVRCRERTESHRGPSNRR